MDGVRSTPEYRKTRFTICVSLRWARTPVFFSWLFRAGAEWQIRVQGPISSCGGVQSKSVRFVLASANGVGREKLSFGGISEAISVRSKSSRSTLYRGKAMIPSLCVRSVIRMYCVLHTLSRASSYTEIMWHGAPKSSERLTKTVTGTSCGA